MFHNELKYRAWACVLTLSVIWAVAGDARSADLAGSEWRPVQFGETEVAGDIDAFVQFKADGELAGNSGCNRFFGTWKSDGDTLTFGPVGSTRMACPRPQMALETALFGAFEITQSYRRDRVDLVLINGDGDEIAQFAQTDAD